MHRPHLTQSHYSRTQTVEYSPAATACPCALDHIQICVRRSAATGPRLRQTPNTHTRCSGGEHSARALSIPFELTRNTTGTSWRAGLTDGRRLFALPDSPFSASASLASKRTSSCTVTNWTRREGLRTKRPLCKEQAPEQSRRWHRPRRRRAASPVNILATHHHQRQLNQRRQEHARVHRDST